MHKPSQEAEGAAHNAGPGAWLRSRGLSPLLSGLDALRNRPRMQQVLRGSAWSLFGFGAQQALRLVSNVLMAWLLFPEAFGLMALVMVVIQGLQWITETGVNLSVVQDARGHEPRFVQTAWTVRLLRGAILWLLAVALAWPAAALYNEPRLLALIPVVAVIVLFHGAASPATFTLARQVNLGRLTGLRIGTQVSSLGFAVALAWVWPSVWVLALRAVLQSILFAIGSYLLPGDWPRPRFHLDREAAGRIYRFGRWILLSSAIGFFINQGDKAVLGTLMTPAELGVYSIAAIIAMSLWYATATISHQVFIPVFARLSEEGIDHLRPRLVRARLGLMAVSLPACCVLAIFGPEIIGLLYDDRYSAAGWVLQALAIGMVGSLVGGSFSGVPEALGDSFRVLIMNIARGLILLLMMLLGAWAAGRYGLILGVASAYFLHYLPMAWMGRAHGVWTPRLDLAVLSATSGVIALGLYAKPYALALLW